MKVFGELTMSKDVKFKGDLGQGRGESSNSYERYDLIKEILTTALVLVLLYGYWLGTLLVLSIILVNVWKVLFVELLFMAGGLTIISAIFYIRARKKKWTKK